MASAWRSQQIRTCAANEVYSLVGAVEIVGSLTFAQAGKDGICKQVGVRRVIFLHDDASVRTDLSVLACAELEAPAPLANFKQGDVAHRAQFVISDLRRLHV